MKNSTFAPLFLAATMILAACGNGGASSEPAKSVNPEPSVSQSEAPSKEASSEDAPETTSSEAPVEKSSDQPAEKSSEGPVEVSSETPVEVSSEEPAPSVESSEPASSEEPEPVHVQAPFEYPEVPFQTVNPNADYSFEPQLPESLATIDIVSEDGKNDFVTVPDRLNKPDYTNCKISVSGCADKYVLSEVAGGVKVRGNYTANYDKKPLRIKFEKKQSMLGLNGGLKAKSWVLLADVKDSSMLRNTAAFYLGHKILGSDGLYTTDFLPVRVNINGSFWGTYLLVEQQQVNAGRVEISEPEKDWTTNDFGYFVEYDGYYTEEGPDGDPTFTLNYANNGAMSGPNNRRVNPGNNGYTMKNDIYHDSQRAFAGTYLENVYRVAYYATRGTSYNISEDGLKTVSAPAASIQDHLNRYIDLQSMVDTYILNEIACDPDIGWSSFYLDFDMGEGADHRLRFEAPWDWDSAFGNRSGYCENARDYYAYGSTNPWLTVLTGQTFFQNMIKAKWTQLVENNVFQDMFDTLHAYSTRYESDYAANFQRWNHMGGNYGGTSGELRAETRSVYSQNDARRFLEDWLGDRLTYLSSVYGDGRDLHCGQAKVETAPAGTTKNRLEAEAGTVFGGATVKNDNTSSGRSYIGNLDGTTDSGTRWTFNASAAGKAYVAYGLAKQVNSRDPSEMFDLKVNGQTIIFPERRNPAAANADNRWHDWGEVYMGEIELKNGENTLEICSRGSSTNFDYVDLYTL